VGGRSQDRPAAGRPSNRRPRDGTHRGSHPSHPSGADGNGSRTDHPRASDAC
jgi:hypothetical protein